MVADEMPVVGDPPGQLRVGERPATLDEERGARAGGLQRVEDPGRVLGSSPRSIAVLGVEGERDAEWVRKLS